MSLRDEIAVAAMQGLCANPEYVHYDALSISIAAYAVADAMIKQIDVSCPVCGEEPDKDGKILHKSGCTHGWEV